ncbi:MAG: 30S ribosomal protein S16 [Kiritimatiellia bacterium]
MSVRIRLTRMGNRNNPFYRIVVANSANANKGKAIEFLGTYDPKGGGRTVLKKDRYAYWLGVGAIPSDTVRSLIDRAEDHAAANAAAAEAEPAVEAAETAAAE